MNGGDETFPYCCKRGAVVTMTPISSTKYNVSKFRYELLCNKNAMLFQL